jgi:protein-glutamine gamma-glutamyltransferase
MSTALRQKFQQLRSFNAATRPSQVLVEDSVALRVSVQALVAVGILATDMAAATGNGLWAIPLSLVGATWSYRQRHQRNLGAKIGIAVGMLLVLFFFLSRLVTQLGDSRGALAELLIQLQVLHTFDMPRRKDLGYSAVIGVILLGVAATLSETTVFGGFLLLFLAIALPVLMLDYRSRLGLGAVKQQIFLAPRRLLGVLVMIVVLGLTIFALLPRLPGYQLRTFPVSPPIEFQGQFEGQKIVNPGYVKGQPSQSGKNGSTFADSAETGQVDAEFYSGFNQTINQNLRGSLTPKVVMRVRSQAEGFWRVLSFDQYTGQGWTISRNDQVQTLRRPAWSYRFFTPLTVAQSKSKEIIQTYSILADFPNLIPALSQPKEIYFPTREIAIDLEGSLRSPVQLEEGLTYTVISEVPYRDRTELNQITADYPAKIRQSYLQLPADLSQPIRQQAEALLSKATQRPTSAYEKSLFLAQALKQNYTLQPNLPPLSAKQDLVEAFLFQFEGGYPDHFSTTLTVMLRSLGIPARLTTGFGPGQFNAFTGMYVVKNTDAYAVTEVYFPKHGWFAFDPIPGHALIPPSVEQNQTFTVLRQFWNWVAGWLPSPLTGLLSGVLAGMAAALTRLSLLTGWQGLLMGLLLVLSLLFLGWLGRLLWRHWRYHCWLTTLPPMARLYQQMLDRLSERGLPKRSQQTPQEYVQQIKRQSPLLAEIVAEISHAYVGWRYGGRQANLPYLRQQLQVLTKLRSHS